MKKNLPLLISILLTSILVHGQPGPNELTQDLRWRSIGPANMMGRIAAMEALNTDYRHVLLGSASGGRNRNVRSILAQEKGLRRGAPRYGVPL